MLSKTLLECQMASHQLLHCKCAMLILWRLSPDSCQYNDGRSLMIVLAFDGHIDSQRGGERAHCEYLFLESRIVSWTHRTSSMTVSRTRSPSEQFLSEVLFSRLPTENEWLPALMIGIAACCQHLVVVIPVYAGFMHGALHL